MFIIIITLCLSSRLSHLIGYDKNDLVGHVPFEFHHHDDVYATLGCAKDCKSL